MPKIEQIEEHFECTFFDAIDVINSFVGVSSSLEQKADLLLAHLEAAKAEAATEEAAKAEAAKNAKVCSDVSRMLAV